MKARFRTVASLLGLAAVGAISVAGCGGGGASATSDGSSDFVAGAEAACSKANGQIAALGTPRQEQVTEYMESTEAVLEALQREVAALGPADAAEVAYAKGLARAIPVLTGMSNAARNENFDAVRELSAGLVEIHLGELAEAAKLKTCAEVPASES